MGDGQGAEGAAVKRTLERDKMRALFALLAVILKRQLERGLVGLRSTIAEEDLVHAGQLGHATGDVLGIRMPVEVADVQGLAHLLSQRRN